MTSLARDPSKLGNIQGLRGIAVMLVVLFHLGTIEAKYGGGAFPDGALLPDLVTAGLGGVDLFFVISGFIMATVTRGAFASARHAWGFLSRRAQRIYPLYWTYTAMVAAVFLFRPAWVNASQGGSPDFPASLLLMPMAGLPALMVGWTLIFEMHFYLVMAAMLASLPERLFPWALAAWAGLVAWGSLAMGWPGESGGPWLGVAFAPLALEFIAGASIALLHHGNRLRLPVSLARTLVWAGPAALFAAYWGFRAYAGAPANALPELWPRTLLFGIPSVAMVAGAAAWERERPGGMPAWLIRIGDASYSIYLSHVLVLSALGRIWGGLRSPGRLDNAVALPVLFLAALGAGFASQAYLERPIARWFQLRRRRAPEGGSGS